MPLTTQPFSEVRELKLLRKELHHNVGQPERLASLIGGAALLAFGASQRSLGGVLLALLGGSLVYRGATGHCELYKRLGVDTAGHNLKGGVEDQQGVKIEKTIRIGRTPSYLYDFWRELDNLPTIMSHLQSVTNLGSGRSHWVAKAPAGTTVEWDAEIIIDRPGEMISWESLPGSDIPNAGSVWFTKVEGGLFTDVKVALSYDPPAGAAGVAIAKLFGEDPEKQLDEDLARFKEAMESPVTTV